MTKLLSVPVIGELLILIAILSPVHIPPPNCLSL
jgi:hypothetical protein